MKSIAAVNDFVVKFANVNGSGSASANEMFAKSILRMGVPVSPRNIFPSNIQGLPTWYEVRVNERGWLGRRGGVDLMVAMNPQTWDADIAEIEPGGYLFHDSTRPLPKSKFRDDVRACQGVIFVTPEYNRGVPGPMKNAIDVGSRPYGQGVWKGKPAGVVSVSPGAMGAFGANQQLRQSLVFVDMPVLQQPEAYVGHAATLFDESGKLANDKTAEFMKTFLNAYAAWVERLV